MAISRKGNVGNEHAPASSPAVAHRRAKRTEWRMRGIEPNNKIIVVFPSSVLPSLRFGNPPSPEGEGLIGYVPRCHFERQSRNPPREKRDTVVHARGGTRASRPTDGFAAIRLRRHFNRSEVKTRTQRRNPPREKYFVRVRNVRFPFREIATLRLRLRSQ